MKTLSYIQLQERYGGKFVAKSNGHVLATGLTYKALISQISKKHLKRDKLIFAYIHPKGAVCVYRRYHSFSIGQNRHLYQFQH